MSDRHGCVDVTPTYLAGVTGLALDEIVACMQRFCQPDPYSRSDAEQGARLVLLDGHRDWGWRIVNHAWYRDKARKATFDSERTASGQDAHRKKEARANVIPIRPDVSGNVPTCPDVSRRIPPSDSDSDSDSNADKSKNKKKTVRGATRRCPDDFTPDSEFALAEIPDLDIEREIANFRDCEFRTPHSDWAATWRRWIRTARDQKRYAVRQATVRKWE